MSNELLIFDYKAFYQKLSLRQGKRQQVLSTLADLLNRYTPYIESLKEDKDFYEFEFFQLTSDIDDFIKTTFSQEVYKLFKNPSVKPEVKKKTKGDSDSEMFRELLKAIKESKRTHSAEKVRLHTHQYSFLYKIYSCLKDYGLHKEIQTRDKSIHARFNVIIEHKHKRKTVGKEYITLISFQKLNEEYIKAYKTESPILINGTKIPYNDIQRLKITSSILKDDEIPNFKEKHGLRTDLQFILACHDETNNLLENSSIGKSINLNAETWNLIHPKLQILIKPLFFNSQFNEAVRTVFIELNDIIKQEFLAISGEELDGDKLMKKVFSPNNPTFHLADLSNQSGQDVQQGYMEIFAGAMKGIRNPKAHKNMEVEPIEALEKILIASHLLKVFEARKK